MKKLLLIAMLFITSCSVPWFHRGSTFKLSGATAPVTTVVKTYTQCGTEWNWCDFKQSKPTTQVVRFGDEGHYVFKTFTGYGTQCNWNNFSVTDPHPGTTGRACALETSTVVVSPPAPLPVTDTYTACSNEWQQCRFKGTVVVRYGVPDHYIFQSFTSADGSGIACKNATFGSDPAPGKTKACATKDAPVVVPPVVVPPADAGTPSIDAGVIDAGTLDANVPPVVVPPVVVPPVVVPPVNGKATRPSTSKGVGLFIIGTKLYDSNGNEFKIRGTSKTHWDNTSPGLSKMNTNTTRWIIDFTRSATSNVSLMNDATRSGTIGQKNVVIPGNWDGTCNSDQATFDKIVSTWITQIPTWSTLEKHMILNIANEWGSNQTAWRDAYVAAIPKIRAAGWHGVIMIDAPTCGQDATAILKYGADVFAADPEKNTMFDWHVYGYVFDTSSGITRQWAEQMDLEPTAAALKASGLLVIIGEFGPGRNIGPSPTMVTPKRIMQVGDAYGLGLLGWSVDDNNQANAMADDNSFAWIFNTTGPYNTTADLTTFGRVVVEDPDVGLKAKAQLATDF